MARAETITLKRADYDALVTRNEELERNYQYRVTTGYWIKEVQRTVLTLEGIVDALTQRTFEKVPSLSKYNKPVDVVHITLERVPGNIT